MTSMLKYVLAFFLSVNMIQCNYVTNTVNGKGNVIEQEIQIAEFTSLTLKNGWEIELIPSDENKMLITANENLMEELRYDNTKGELLIEAENNIGKANKKLIQLFYTEPIKQIKASSGVYLHSASPLKATNLNTSISSGSMIKLNLDVEDLTVKSSSGANILLSGKSQYTEIEASSGSGINALELISKEAKAKTSSGSSLKLNVSEVLSAESSSGGVIKYEGEVQSVERSTSSGGTIKPL